MKLINDPNDPQAGTRRYFKWQRNAEAYIIRLEEWFRGYLPFVNSDRQWLELERLGAEGLILNQCHWERYKWGKNSLEEDSLAEELTDEQKEALHYRWKTRFIRQYAHLYINYKSRSLCSGSGIKRP